MTEISTAPAPGLDPEHDLSPPDSTLRRLAGRISRLELVVGGVIAAILLALVLIEPDILEAPFENERTILFTVGGTVIAALAFVAMLWFRVPPIVRVIVLVPFAIVNWWLISPYFVDDVVDEAFSTSISEQVAAAEEPPTVPAPPTTIAPVEAAAPSSAPGPDATAVAAPAAEPAATVAPTAPTAPAATPAPPTGPVLRSAGQFVGLTGHSGTGDAGIFENPDGSLVLRFENFDIENGPDLEVYLVPGADQTSLADGSVHLGALKGNIGDQNYELPAGTALVPGAYTVLVWCEAFSVEFVGATLLV